MTIAVRISNEDKGDAARTVLVTTIQYEKGKHGSRVTQQQHIQPGQSAVFHVHLLTDLCVGELEVPS